MSVDRYVKKGVIFSLIFIAIGVLSGITGFIFNFHKEVMTGLTAGFLPTGIGMLILYQISKNKPEMLKNIELENEERNIFINTKAGCTAFWICFYYIFASVILYHLIELSFLTFLIITLCFMPILYFTLVIVYHKIY